MNTLVINAGSTTIKFKLFDNNLEVPVSGMIDRKDNKYQFVLKKEGNRYQWDVSDSDYENRSAELILKELANYSFDKIGFRVVHGGELFIKPIPITPTIIEKLEEFNTLAPLHNPPAIKSIKQFMKALPEINKYAVFDTAFYSTIPEKAYLYGLPYEYYQMYKIRRYGFHGTSHKYVNSILHSLEPVAKKIITCHLGGGASITAINEGKAIDTSMGFTPLEGLIMATRPGDVDDGAINYLAKVTGFSQKEILEIENKKSGILGISGISSDMRTLLKESQNGSRRAQLAIDMYVYRIQKCIGAYAAALGGIDAVAVTAGVGAGSDIIRKKIFENMDYLSLKIDNEINNGKINVEENLKISSDQSKPIWIIPTDEELQIAKEILI